MEKSSPTIGVSVDDGEVVVGAQAMGKHDVFECNICVEPPTNSVLTKCGHMFCWSCLYQWLQNTEKPCQVCTVMVGSGNVTPIYGCQRGSSSKSSNSSIPPRPSAPSECRLAMQMEERVGTTNISLASNSTTPSDHGLVQLTLVAAHEGYDNYEDYRDEDYEDDEDF